MEALYPHTPAQKLFASMGALFFLSLLLTVYLRSSGRKSILTSAAAFGGESAVFDSLENTTSGGSALELQDFHRLEIKDGKPVWEVRAKNAKYLPDQGITHVNQTSVTLYREEGSAVHVSSKAARLHMEGDSISKAELDGEVNVSLENSIELRTNQAVYSLTDRVFEAPEDVQILGDGFEVRGIGLEFELEKQIVKLDRQVYSYFSTQAHMPSDVAKVRK